MKIKSIMLHKVTILEKILDIVNEMFNICLELQTFLKKLQY